MKGISPMIATILLIAFTVAIGGVLSVWLTGLTSTQTTQVSNQSSSQVKCTPSLSIDRIDSNSANMGQINVTVTNPSQSTVVGMNISVVYANTSVISNNTNINLAAGTSYFTNIGNFSTLPTLVKVAGLCSGLPVSFTCKPTDPCWRGT